MTVASLDAELARLARRAKADAVPFRTKRIELCCTADGTCGDWVRWIRRVALRMSGTGSERARCDGREKSVSHGPTLVLTRVARSDRRER
jgi:hypothetical protein